MENKKEIKTLKDLYDQSNESIDEFLNMTLITQEDSNNFTNVYETMKGFESILKSLLEIVTKVIKQQNILGAMCNFLLSRYNDIARLHRADLDLDDIEADKDKMYDIFDKNK